jgi:hypothetical protein
LAPYTEIWPQLVKLGPNMKLGPKYETWPHILKL